MAWIEVFSRPVATVQYAVLALSARGREGQPGVPPRHVPRSEPGPRRNPWVDPRLTLSPLRGGPLVSPPTVLSAARGLWYPAHVPSRDAQWIIGTIVAAVIALSVQISSGHAELRSDIREIRSDIRGLDDRLRAVEIAFGRVDQRLATLERLHLPTPDPAD